MFVLTFMTNLQCIPRLYVQYPLSWLLTDLILPYWTRQWHVEWEIKVSIGHERRRGLCPVDVTSSVLFMSLFTLIWWVSGSGRFVCTFPRPCSCPRPHNHHQCDGLVFSVLKECFFFWLSLAYLWMDQWTYWFDCCCFVWNLLKMKTGIEI